MLLYSILNITVWCIKCYCVVYFMYCKVYLVYCVVYLVLLCGLLSGIVWYNIVIYFTDVTKDFVIYKDFRSTLIYYSERMNV